MAVTRAHVRLRNAQVRLNARAPNDEDETQRYNPHLPASLLAGVRVDYWTLQSSRARDNLEVVVLRGRCERKARGWPRLVYPHICFLNGVLLLLF